jgi:hypothetical protein
MRNLMFRGYDIVEHLDGRCVISQDAKIVSEQPTIEAAREWINTERRKAIK